MICRGEIGIRSLEVYTHRLECGIGIPPSCRVVERRLDVMDFIQAPSESGA